MSWRARVSEAALSLATAAQQAAARARVAIYNYGAHGASVTKKRMAGWRPSASGPETDITQNLDRLRARSRDLYMGEPIANGAVRTIKANALGAGLQLNATPDVKFLGISDDQALAFEEAVEREWALWAGTKACDAARKHNFGELQSIALTSQLVSGDVFVLLPSFAREGDRYDLHVQLIEGDLCANPPLQSTDIDINGGVEVGEYGEPIAYHFMAQHPGDQRAFASLSQKWRRVPAFGDSGRPLVLHLMESERPGQRRGVPIFAATLSRFKQLERYIEAELDAAVTQALFTAAITTAAPTSHLGISIPAAQQVTGGADERTLELAPGALMYLEPGEKLEAVSPTRPNSGFDAFVHSLCKQIGSSLGVPYEVLLMEFTASYSASRGALQEAWKRFTVITAGVANNLCQPVYDTLLAEMVVRGRVEAPGFLEDPLRRAAWAQAEWIPPPKSQLDPTKEVEAAKMRVAEGFSTRVREAREMTGIDFYEAHRARVREESLRRELGGGQTLTLTPTSQEIIARVDEGRAASGLPPEADPTVGRRYIVEHAAIIKAAAAPQIAEAAAAEQGKTAPTEEAASAPPAPPAEGSENEPAPEGVAVEENAA